MSKERLEEAKLMAEMLRVETRLPHDFPFDLVDWLVEQAERVQELENHIDHLYDNNVHLKGDYRLQEQNKRYREAIEKAIGGCRYTNSEVAYILQKALEGEE